MISPSYLFKRAKETDIKNWISTAKRLSKETGKNWVSIFKDMIHCTMIYSAGYVDYDTLGMYKMTEEERANVLTVGKNNDFVRELNDPEKSKIFGDKAEFNKVFKDYVKRDWVLLDGKNFTEFEKLAKKHSVLIAKPTSLSCGSGIQRVEIKQDTNLSELYDKLYEDGAALIEEVIVQDDEMSKLCTTSVNTIRIVTVRNEDKVTPTLAVVRMGREGNFVDNFNYGGYGAKKGGFAAVIDLETGKVIVPAYDKNREEYETIPVLGTKVVGFQIPRWKECLDFVKEAAFVVPEVRFIAWDVCISKDRGLLLIEGNEFPGNDLQFPKLDMGTYGAMLRALDRA